MNIALLSGAYKNAGDFLITHRANLLLQRYIPDSNIAIYTRNNISAYLKEINQMDAVVVSGGPIYMPDIVSMFDVDIRKTIKKPIMVVGGGWYGYGNGSNQIYQYKINKESYRLLKYIDDYGYGLSCRDICSIKALSKYKFKTMCLTGCPAWYDLDNIDNLSINGDFSQIKKIVVSDPARTENYSQVLRVVRFLKSRFPSAQIIFAFHRGIKSDIHTAKKTELYLKKLNNDIQQLEIKTVDLSYGVDGFSVYDNCDLHVGYRVHAHIYCLSKRIRTILIEEDGRGAGLDMTLGLPNIKAYDDRFQPSNKYSEKLYRMSNISRNRYIIQELDNYLNILQLTDDQPLKNSFILMQKYFQNMVSFITRLI